MLLTRALHGAAYVHAWRNVLPLPHGHERVYSHRTA